MLNDAIAHYFNTVETYEGDQADVKKSDKHMDGFSNIIKSKICSYKIKEKHKAIIQGRFLNKRWDLLFYNHSDKNVLELKSVVLSKIGKCFSNRVEECIGVAFDLKHIDNSIKLHYFLAIENDLGDKNIDNKVNKIFDFLYYINHEAKLYDNVCGLVFNKNNYEFIYNNFDNFVKHWNTYEL